MVSFGVAVSERVFPSDVIIDVAEANDHLSKSTLDSSKFSKESGRFGKKSIPVSLSTESIETAKLSNDRLDVLPQ